MFLANSIAQNMESHNGWMFGLFHFYYEADLQHGIMVV